MRVSSITWYERQKARKTNPFFRLLDRSFGFRLLLAALSALLLLALVHRFEVCRAKNYSPECEFADIPAVISIDNVESFSILTAALLYIFERGQRKRREHLEMGEILNANRESGAVRSFSRIIALETLSRDGIWLDGQDFHGANLEGLEVPNGRLRGVNFSEAVLISADFRGADLTGANFTNADLTNANFTGANLTDADLTGANIKGVDLTDTRVTGAKIERRPHF
jgi:hypothetical protein